jgi:type IV pilus secretin PilQ/predicted competence protein
MEPQSFGEEPMTPKLKSKTGMLVWMGLILITLGSFSPFSWAREVDKPQAELLDIQSNRTPDLLRLQLTVTQPIKIRPFILQKPTRLVLDLSPCRLSLKQPPAIPEDPLLSDFRVSQFNPYTTRIVLIVPRLPSFQVYPSKDSPLIWQVDLAATPGKKTAPEVVLERSSPRPKEVLQLNEFKKEQEGSLKPPAPVPPPRVAFDFYNADLHNVLRLLGEVGQVNILVSDEVKGKITVSLKDMPWDQALDLVLTNNKLVKVQQGKTYRVTTLKDYVITEGERRREEQNVYKADQEIQKAEQELLKAEAELRKVQEGRLPFMTKTFRLNYVSVEAVKKIIDEIWSKDPAKKEKGIASSIPQTNTLFVRATRTDLDQIEKLIRSCDLPTAQVMIEARIVEADASFTRDFGLRWGGNFAYNNPYAPFAGTIRGGDAGGGNSNYAVNLPLTTGAAFGGLGLAFASANFNLDIRLQAMEKQGKGKTISSPKIITLDNKEAVIKQGQKIPITTQTSDKNYTTTYIDAALLLRVTPHIASNQKKITLNVVIENNEPNFAEKDSLGNPAIKTKEARTEMTINNGDTVVIGGIIFKKEETVEDRIPWLGDIPVLGWLFKTQYRNYKDTELIIFLTPKVVIPLSERFDPGT